MEFKGSIIINRARTELHNVIADFVKLIYLKLTNGVNPNFEEDEEYTLEDSEFDYKAEVFDTYTDEYYLEERTATGISCALDNKVFLIMDNGLEEEFDIDELSTDYLERLAVDLEVKYNNLLNIK